MCPIITGHFFFDFSLFVFLDSLIVHLGKCSDNYDSFYCSLMMMMSDCLCCAEQRHSVSSSDDDQMVLYFHLELMMSNLTMMNLMSK